MLDDELAEIEEGPVRGIMAGNHMAKYYEAEAESFMQPIVNSAMPDADKKLWHATINECITPYLKMREAKYNQFSDGVIKYVLDGTLPQKKNENGLMYTFNNLDADEREQLAFRINKIFLTGSQKVASQQEETSYASRLFTFFGLNGSSDDIVNCIRERAEKFTSGYEFQNTVACQVK